MDKEIDDFVSNVNNITLPKTVLVEMRLYRIDAEGWAWVAPLEEQHTTTGVNVRLSRIRKQ